MTSDRTKTPVLNPESAAFALRIRKSHIQGWGVFAAEPIPARCKVIEYTGERIGAGEAMKRFRRALRRSANPRISLFYLSRRLRIDADYGGSGAEYINHSCEPNLRSRILRGHILFFSLRQIRRGEELSLDYCLDPKSLLVECRCGAPNCRGVMNRIRTRRRRRRSGYRRPGGRGRRGHG